MRTKLFTLIALFCVLTLSSCEKEPLPSTYSLTLDMDFYGTVKVMVFECNDMSEKLHANTVEKVQEGEKYSFTASSDMISKIKIYYSNESFLGDSHKWVQQVFILNREDNTNIVINGDTIVGVKSLNF